MYQEHTRWKQSFYEEVEPIRLRDYLAEFLGVICNGEEFIFYYTDVVKLAGHSCPAVAGAFKMTQKALNLLYGKEVPVRGDISVKVLGDVDDGANGPMSQVISFVTGAATETGFAGINNRYVRKNKLVFIKNSKDKNTFMFTRDDTQKSIKIKYNVEKIPQSEEFSNLFIKNFSGKATKDEVEKFQSLWQEKVRLVLFDKIENLFTIEEG